MDAPMLLVGGQIFPEGAYLEIADAIVLILGKAYDVRLEQETIKEALDVLVRVAKVEHVSITNSTFTNHPAAAVEVEG